MSTPSELSSRLVQGLVDQGHLSGAWRDVFIEVERHRFIPDTVWTEGSDTALRRADRPEAWLRACYTDQPVITQMDDGAGTGAGYSSSSASMPTTVAMMLEATDLRPGHRVLEIGTGTGYNAALLAARAGARNVVSTEVDPDVAERARASLERTGYRVEVLTGDGTLGHPAGAPFDRVLSTAAVQRVPYAWVEQTVPGGRIVTPWGTALHNGALLSLEVGADGTASGRFCGNVAFMWVRGQRTPHGAVEDRVRAEHEYAESTTGLHPYYVLSQFDASFAVGLRMPVTGSVVVFDGDDPASDRYTVYLMDAGSGSWASWRVEPGAREYAVRQHGPRRLFEELESAYSWWVGADGPEHTRFGLTVTPNGQHVWLDVPERVVDAPAAVQGGFTGPT